MLVSDKGKGSVSSQGGNGRGRDAQRAGDEDVGGSGGEEPEENPVAELAETLLMREHQGQPESEEKEGREKRTENLLSRM
jgi:hypothetical protein